MCQLSPVTFHGDTIFCIDYQNQPYAPMKSIVQNMGLDWASQSVKLNANKVRWGVVMIATPSEGGEQKMLSMPVRKLPAWLNSINPKKVRPELRERIELYQAECDDALWDYWMHGKAERPTADQPTPQPTAPITPADQSILQSIVKAKIEALPEERRSKGIYPQIWGRFNNHFRLGSYKQLPQCRMADAVAYLTQLAVREPAQALPPTPPTIEPLRVTDNDSADLDAHLDAIQEHIRAIFDHQCSIFRLGRNALPSRSAVPSRVWGASVLTLDSLEKSSDALRACLASLELSARAAVVAGRA